MKRLLVAGIVALIAGSAFASPAPPPMRESVAVCDPAFPSNCNKPTSGGFTPVIPYDSIPISSTVGVGNLVSLTGATISNGAISFTGANQSAVIDTRGAGGWSALISGTFSGLVVRAAWANDLSGSLNNSGLIYILSSESNTPPNNSMQGVGNYYGPKEGRYLILTTTTLSSGTAIITPNLNGFTPPIPTAFVNNPVTAPVFSATAASASGGYTFKDIAAGATTVVKSGAGFFHTLTIQTYVASATITMYDNTAGSGTLIGIITLPSTITGDAPVTLTYDEAFATGLTIVTSGATDINVSFK